MIIPPAPDNSLLLATALTWTHSQPPLPMTALIETPREESVNPGPPEIDGAPLSTVSRALPAGKTINDVFPHLEEVGEAIVRALPEPRLVKTHLPFERTPWHSTARYVGFPQDAIREVHTVLQRFPEAVVEVAPHGTIRVGVRFLP
jgi:hypothetical protein